MGNRKLLNPELGRLGTEEYRSLPARGVVVVLDNIRSAHNVGSAFRTCDAFRADALYLCGICATPPSAEIHKTALGAEDSVPWRYFSDTMEAVPYGKPGLIDLMTPLMNTGPLLSIMTDDIGILHNDKCDCGAPSPWLEIIGRVGIKDVITCAQGSEEYLEEDT